MAHIKTDVLYKLAFKLKINNNLGQKLIEMTRFCEGAPRIFRLVEKYM
jgi:hypothetical protein